MKLLSFNYFSRIQRLNPQLTRCISIATGANSEHVQKMIANALEFCFLVLERLNVEVLFVRAKAAVEAQTLSEFVGAKLIAVLKYFAISVANRVDELVWQLTTSRNEKIK